MNQNERAKLMRKYKAALHASEQSKAEAEQYKAEIKEELIASGEREFTAGGAKTWITHTSDSVVFDSKRFAEDYPELYQAYCVTKPGIDRHYIR